MPIVPATELTRQTKTPLEQVDPQNLLMALAEMHRQGAISGPQPEVNSARNLRSRPKVTKTG